MDELLKIFSTWLKKEEYKKILMSVLVLFSFIAPSVSIIFLYKRNLFLELDIFRLIIICLIMNVIIFIMVLCLTVIDMKLNNKKVEIEIVYELNKIKPKIQELKNNGNYKEIDLQLMKLEEKYAKELFALENYDDNTSLIIESFLRIVTITLYLWLYYYFNNLFNIFSEDYSDIALFFIMFIMPLAPVVCSFLNLPRFYKDAFIKKIKNNFLDDYRIKRNDFLDNYRIKMNSFLDKYRTNKLVKFFIGVLLYLSIIIYLYR